LPDLRISDDTAARRQDSPKPKEEGSVFSGRIERKRANEDVDKRRAPFCPKWAENHPRLQRSIYKCGGLSSSSFCLSATSVVLTCQERVATCSSSGSYVRISAVAKAEEKTEMVTQIWQSCLLFPRSKAPNFWKKSPKMWVCKCLRDTFPPGSTRQEIC
jgi:hypothetical protein